MARIHNFSAGPATLPEEVVTTAQTALYDFQGTGIGIAEMSHRSATFQEVFDSTIEGLRRLLSIPKTHEVLFCTGGATQQFSMVPMNLLTDNFKGAYLNTGVWSKKATAEAKKFGSVYTAGSAEQGGFKSVCDVDSLEENTAYLHFTSNNTIFGTQFSQEPEAGDIPLACDASSDILHKPLDISKYGILYAGSQKNLGPAGVTVVIARKDLIDTDHTNILPVTSRYKTYLDSNSLYNTPPTFPIYFIGEVLKWIEAQGGLSNMEALNKEKASLLYQVIDHSDFYQGHAEPEARSLMNVTFTLKDADRTPHFLTLAEEAGLSGLKGHRLVGGLRASIYNAMPVSSVQVLVDFMKHYEKQHG